MSYGTASNTNQNTNLNDINRSMIWDTRGGVVYRVYTSGRTDQFRYDLTLEITKSDGKTARYQVAWQDDSFVMLPDDVRDLYEATSSMQGSECSPMPGGSPR